MKRWWPLLLVALCLGVLSPLASSLPDGLESVAEHVGFARRAAEPALPSPLPGYAVPGREESAAANAAVGIAGTLVVFGLALGLGRILARRTTGNDRGSSPQSES